MDYFELQSNGDYIESKIAYATMKLKTESSLIKHLQFVYCMENRNECIFDEETCKLQMRNYMKNILKYEKVDDLYQNNNLSQNYIDIPNLQRLGSELLLFHSKTLMR